MYAKEDKEHTHSRSPLFTNPYGHVPYVAFHNEICRWILCSTIVSWCRVKSVWMKQLFFIPRGICSHRGFPNVSSLLIVTIKFLKYMLWSPFFLLFISISDVTSQFCRTTNNTHTHTCASDEVWTHISRSFVTLGTLIYPLHQWKPAVSRILAIDIKILFCWSW